MEAKLRPPALPAGFVVRPRLERLLDAGTQRRLTLVSAHAGTGKSLLLAGWALRADERPGWISLDRGDSAGSALWEGVELALDAVAGPEPRIVRRRTGDDPARRILDRAAALTRPVTLVVDDLHELRSRPLLEAFGALVRNAPPELRFVVATRADPVFPLHRLRLAGELTELRATELAFTEEEARELLGDAGDRVSESGLRVLHRRTEGWAAGLRLAALSVGRATDADGFVAAFAGDDRSVADYLVCEVLEGQSAERRDFLLATSVATRLPADLAALLSGRADAADLLEQLEGENLFVSREGSSRLDFRYHPLFREFLRAELANSSPEAVRELNERAAAWCHAHGEPFAALGHAVAGAAWSLADAIAAEGWEELLAAGDPVGLRAVLARVPAAAARSHASLAVLVGLDLLDTGEAAEGVAATARALARLGPDGVATSALAAYAAATLARRRGDPRESALCAEAVLAEPADAGAAGLRRAHVRRAVARLHLGAALVALDELDEAERALELAHEQALDEGLDSTVADVLAQRALLEAARGRLRRSAELGAEAVGLAERHGRAGALAEAGARVALGWAHLQWDEPEAAEMQLELARAAARATGDSGSTVAAALLGALVDATGGAAGAERGLRRLHSAVGEARGAAPPAFLAPVLAAAEARLLAARGDLGAAEAALDALEPADDAGRLARALVRARLELACGRPGGALALLADAPRAGPRLHAIEAQLLVAVARAEERERTDAHARLEAALELAAAERYRRVFVDGGPAVRMLLVEAVRRGTAHRAFVGELLAAFQRRAPGVEITRTELLAPLSARERAVLRYLPTMMSNNEIAGELFVSVNTVKTHLRSVYRKLGATRRRDAVERARRLDLL